MIHFAPRTGLAAVLIGAVFAGALAPGATASLNVNRDNDQAERALAADARIYIYPARATPAEEAAARADAVSPAPPDEPRPAAEHVSRAGFDWRAAGMGAGAGFVLVAAGGLVLARRPRIHVVP